MSAANPDIAPLGIAALNPACGALRSASRSAHKEKRPAISRRPFSSKLF